MENTIKKEAFDKIKDELNNGFTNNTYHCHEPNFKQDKIVRFQFDFNYFALLPCINFNHHSTSLEFEWLWFGIYIDFDKS